MPDLANRGKFESRLADELIKSFEKYIAQIQGIVRGPGAALGDVRKLPPGTFEQLQIDLIEDLKGVLIEAYTAAFVSIDGLLADASQGTARRGELFIRNEAEQWADNYAPALAEQITTVTKDKLRAIAERSPLLPISGGGLRDVLQPVFGLGRAQLIARTELTSAISAAELRATELMQFDFGISPVMIWYTKLDERVCVICEPRHGRERGTNWQIPPPAHPRCRCEIKWRVTFPDGRTIEVMSLEEVQLGNAQLVEL